ncbi:MAG TPA: type I restriction-modification system subunit M N-terminal domain-containing protein, partial [Paludibacteraceae bacterium]|nr:type I restriction-modification system subunit M N-terminal domain-containing protein [Paludibacteraceae bacterium]
MGKKVNKNENKQEEPLEKQPLGKLEATLWKAADKLRKNIDAAEYKHVVLGLIFLKYISDAFEELYARLKAEEELGADPPVFRTFSGHPYNILIFNNNFIILGVP